MKTKEVFKFLFNPFTRIAGWEAFGIGMIIALITGTIAAWGGVYFDGVLDAHVSEEPYSLWESYLILAIDLVSLVLVMWIAGLIFSKRFRFIDILGTMTLARAPYLFIALLGLLMPESDISFLLENPMALVEDPSLWTNLIPVMAFGLLMIPFTVWSVALMYKAFKTSCVIKQSRIVAIFVVALIVAEVVSKLLLNWIM